MQIQQKAERDFWTRSLLAVVPDVLIGVAIGLYTGTNILIAAIATVVGLQILYIALWAKDAAWGWIVFRLSGDRKRLRDTALEFLRKNRFPEPEEFLYDVDSYFTSVMKNSELPCDLRIKAAVELTPANAMAKFKGKLRVVMAWEDAIERYKRAFERARARTENASSAMSNSAS